MLTGGKKELIALSMVPGVGPRAIYNICEKCPGTKGPVLSPGRETPAEAYGISLHKEVLSVKRSKKYIDEMACIESEGIGVVTFWERDYPQNLKDIHTPPVLLYYKGTLTPEDRDAVAIVGSRRCSVYGMQAAERLAYDLAQEGFTIISGMARGIDTAAHRGALRAGGRTLAVLGSGLRNIYPPESVKLSRSISDNGALITEFVSSEEPLRKNFPRRNRIISGLARGVIVVEASEKSGALITVDYALDQGKDVFAVPGKIDSGTSKGTNNLIQSGAKLVTCAGDIIEEIGPSERAIQPRRTDKRFADEDPGKARSGEADLVLNLMSRETPVHIDRIIELSEMPHGELRKTLLSLEVSGAIKACAGGTYLKR